MEYTVPEAVFILHIFIFCVALNTIIVVTTSFLNDFNFLF